MKYRDAELLDAIITQARIDGVPVVSLERSQFNRGWPSIAPILKRYGTWEEARRLAVERAEAREARGETKLGDLTVCEYIETAEAGLIGETVYNDWEPTDERLYVRVLDGPDAGALLRVAEMKRDGSGKIVLSARRT